MAKTEPMPVRFSEKQSAILKRVSAVCGVSEAEVARWAVDALGDYFTHHGDRLLLPLHFYETFSVVQLPMPKRNVTLVETLQPGESPSLESVQSRPLPRKRHARTSQRS